MSGPADDGADLIGDMGSGQEGGQNNDASGNGALNAVNKGVDDANGQESEAEKETERKLIKELMDEYEAAREFDKPARVQYGQDRKYAGGTADVSWASDANLIGSFIDILTSFLYAQNPDVSVRAATQVGMTPQDDATDLADTLEIVISKLWRLANLKHSAKRQVRSALSVGIGWIKALVWSQKRPQPAVEKELHDAETQMQKIQALVQENQENPDLDSDVQQAKLADLITGLRAKLELTKEFGINVDFARAEDIQVSLDVSDIADYASADWVSEDMFIPKSALRQRFARIDEEAAAKATLYYQKNSLKGSSGDTVQAATGEEAADGTFSKSAPGATGGTGQKPVSFVKIIELWDRRDGMIKTMCEGVECWAVEPYTPPQGTTRFYPYFQLAFFPVDGLRHPQSLSWRLRKLQDEYSACRSNQRLTRERSIPGLIFNKGLVSPEDATRLENSVIAEMVGIQGTDISMPLQNIVMAKPLPTIDVRLWNTDAIKSDMEALSGVQEALQQTVRQQPKTATEAQIEQTGFASRTSADRDVIEDMLRELALYTAQATIQELPPEEAQRIAGPKAFWPSGMDIDDLLTLVEVDIEAGTTGKPNAQADKAAWGSILPLIQKLMVQVRQTQSSDPALAESMKNLLRETLKRMDDRLDIDEFIPTDPPPPPAPPAPPPPAVSVSLKGVLPAMDAAAIGAKAAGLPPEAAMTPGGAPPAVLPGAPDHPGAHIADGEIPLHPHMPQPLPAVQKTPADGGETQKPKP